MAEATRYVATYKEIAELLIKKEDIHEGLWGIFIRFGLSATNIADAAAGDALFPAAIVPVREIGIQRFEEANNLTVDAAVVNPLPVKVSPGTKRSKKRPKRAG